MGSIEALVRTLKDQGGSALHLCASAPPRLRVKGRLLGLSASGPSEEELGAWVRASVGAAVWQRLVGGEAADFPCVVNGDRYRARCFRRLGGMALVLRTTAMLSGFAELGLPSTVERLAHLRRGFVLVAGPTGAGKSTTAAALLRELENGRPKHVVTVESPVEVTYALEQTTISQREVGTHTESFAAGIASALRQSPDVVFVSDFPDGRTLELAFEAAAAGTLVIGTLRASGVVRALEHLLGRAPGRRRATLNALAEHLSAVVSLLRLQSADGRDHCVAAEILLRNRGTVAALREDELAALPQIMARADTMQTMDEALAALLEARRITLEDAYDHARDKQRFRPQRSAPRAMRPTRLE